MQFFLLFCLGLTEFLGVLFPLVPFLFLAFILLMSFFSFLIIFITISVVICSIPYIVFLTFVNMVVSGIFSAMATPFEISLSFLHLTQDVPLPILHINVYLGILFTRNMINPLLFKRKCQTYHKPHMSLTIYIQPGHY